MYLAEVELAASCDVEENGLILNERYNIAGEYNENGND